MGLRVQQALIVYNSIDYEALSWSQLRIMLPSDWEQRLWRLFHNNDLKVNKLYLQDAIKDLNDASGTIIVHGEENFVKDYRAILEQLVVMSR